MYPFERFSEGAKRVLTLSQQEAARSHHSYIGTEHIMLALLMEQEGIAARVLTDLRIRVDAMRARIDAMIGRNDQILLQQVIPTSRVKKVIELSFEQARDMGDTYVDTEHILLALLLEGEGIAAQALSDSGASLELVEMAVAVQRGRAPRSGLTRLEQPAMPGRPRAAETRMAVAILDEATKLAHDRDATLSTEHILLVLARSDAGRARQILDDHGLDAAAIEKILAGPG